MRASLRAIRADREGVQVAVEQKAGRVRDPQQRAGDAREALQFTRVADVPRHFGGFVARGGEARHGVARCSGRLASRAVGRAAAPLGP